MFNFIKRNKNKKIYLHETERSIRGTRVIIRSAETGKILDEGTNSILYTGFNNAIAKDF